MPIRPEILVWARQTAGMSLDEAAAKVGLKEARGVSPAGRLAALESGQASPSRPLLLKMAKAYRRPLLTFYMSAPPRKGDRGEDFRNLPQRQTEAEPLVDVLLRDIRARQAMVRAVLEDDEEVQPLEFVGSMSINDGVGAVLASIRRTLDLDLSAFRAQGSPDAAFALLRAKVEAAGVFVLLIGNLGSHHTNLDVTAFRGFALADRIAPFIVINDQDAKSAWSFTLLHELAHLWIGATGVSGAFAEGQLERFCNDVASHALLPGDELRQAQVDRDTDLDQAAHLISQFATDRLISRPLVAYRLFRAGLLSEQSWQELNRHFDRERREARDAQRERARAREGGPNYYVVRRHRLGPALLRFVARSMSDGMLTPTKAGKVLGVRPRSVAPLLGGAAPLADRPRP
jgi:Zn-dependent peptidase ImmA (M78 family)/transcriptional regulator with XRE-family HTH domain